MSSRHIINPLTGRHVIFGKKTFYNLVRDRVLNADGSARIPYREYNEMPRESHMIPLKKFKPIIIKSESTLDRIIKLLNSEEGVSSSLYNKILKLIKYDIKILKEFEDIILKEILSLEEKYI